MAKKFVVTDIDGVILDRMAIYGEVFSDLLNKGFQIDRELSKNIFFSTAGTPINQQFKLAINESGAYVRNGVIRLLVKLFFRTSSEREISFFLGAKEILEKMAMEGIGLFATSGSNTDEIVKIMRDENVFYSMILGSEKTEKSSEHISLFASSLKINREEFAENALYIGDGPRDMEIARECGIFAVGITNTVKESVLREAGADAIITDICQLPAYVF